MATKFNLEGVQKNIAKTQRETLVLLANQAQNYFLSSFKKQGFDGKEWEEVKRRIPGEKAYKYPKTKGLQRQTAPILIGAGYKKRGGELRRDVSNMARTAQLSVERVRMIVDLPYAEVHNDGGKNIPMRKYIGQTDELTRMQHDKIDQIFKGIWRV